MFYLKKKNTIYILYGPTITNLDLHINICD